MLSRRDDTWAQPLTRNSVSREWMLRDQHDQKIIRTTETPWDWQIIFRSSGTLLGWIDNRRDFSNSVFARQMVFLRCQLSICNLSWFLGDLVDGMVARWSEKMTNKIWNLITFQVVKMAILIGKILNRNIMHIMHMGKGTSNEIEKMNLYAH